MGWKPLLGGRKCKGHAEEGGMDSGTSGWKIG